MRPNPNNHKDIDAIRAEIEDTIQLYAMMSLLDQLAAIGCNVIVAEHDSDTGPLGDDTALGRGGSGGNIGDNSCKMGTQCATAQTLRLGVSEAWPW